MVNLKENLDIMQKVILNYILSTDDEYKLFDDNNNMVDRGKVIKLVQAKFFNDDTISSIYMLVRNFYKEYFRIPNKDELINYINLKNADIKEDVLSLILSVNISRYTPDFLYKYLKSFVLQNNLNNTLNEVIVHIKTQEISSTNIDEIYDFVRNSININMDVDITNDSMGLDIRNPQSHIQPIKDVKPTGFKYFDKVMGGGWEPKTLIVFQGKPKIGKSAVLSNLAVRGAMQGSNVGIFTVELGDRKYVKRTGANMFSIPMKEYSRFVDDNSIGEINKVIKEFMSQHQSAGELWIKEYPTGGATVIDIESHFLKLQTYLGKKFDMIVVDYINLLKPVDQGATMYERIKKICEDLRKIAQRNGWCVLSATQVKSSYFNSDELYLDSTAESSGLVATVDSLFGITGESDSSRIKIKNLANRDDGHMESFSHFHMDKVYMRMLDDTAPDSEYWPDEDGTQLVENFRTELGKKTRTYDKANATPGVKAEQPKVTEVTAKLADTKQAKTNDNVVMQPNTNFDNEKIIEVPVVIPIVIEDIKQIIEPNINYDDLLKNIE